MYVRRHDSLSVGGMAWFVNARGRFNGAPRKVLHDRSKWQMQEDMELKTWNDKLFFLVTQKFERRLPAVAIL